MLAWIPMCKLILNPMSSTISKYMFHTLVFRNNQQNLPMTRYND
jgi:hypothetical protein